MYVNLNIICTFLHYMYLHFMMEYNINTKITISYLQSILTNVMNNWILVKSCT